MINVFRILAAVLNIYAFICMIRILLTWFPNAAYSKVGRFLSSICDPYLNFFRRFRFLSFRGLDFSPALSICILYALATLCNTFAYTAKITVGFILASILGIIWSLFSTIANFFIVLLIVRLIAFLIMRATSRNSYRPRSTLWDSIDRFLSPFAFKVSSIFSKRNLSYTTSLVISLIFSILVMIILGFAVNLLGGLLQSIPF